MDTDQSGWISVPFLMLRTIESENIDRFEAILHVRFDTPVADGLIRRIAATNRGRPGFFIIC